MNAQPRVEVVSAFPVMERVSTNIHVHLGCIGCENAARLIVSSEVPYGTLHVLTDGFPGTRAGSSFEIQNPDSDCIDSEVCPFKDKIKEVKSSLLALNESGE